MHKCCQSPLHAATRHRSQVQGLKQDHKNKKHTNRPVKDVPVTISFRLTMFSWRKYLSSRISLKAVRGNCRRYTATPVASDQKTYKR